MCANKVTYIETNSCGFAVDRGFSYPELNEHSQHHLKEQISTDCHGGYSRSRTREIGMAEHSDINFQSVFYLIDEVTK